MSLYNMLFGVNARAPMFLACLNLSPSDIPRFRDCYVRDNAIVVYTRTGGGNREYYESEASCRENYPEYFQGESTEHPSGPWNADLRKHPNFVSDVDCDFDCTYAYFFFSFPDEFKEDLKAISQADPDHKPSDKWKALFKTMNENKE